MEPGHRPAQALTDSRLGLRSAAVSVLLVGIAFLQNPGLLVADTKFDLAAEPVGFLARALHLWDPWGAFGQLQNQAYGYLWPMGPFFALGDVLDLQAWVVQRLWLALVLVVAFLGTARLARALGVRSDLACLVAGLAYALSPRMLSTLGPISVEAWPSAVAPWVLLPLVVGAREGSPRRMAMLSGVAVAMVGGVNAVATFAVIPLGAVWLLTRTRGPRRRSLMLWWPVFTLLGTLWWLVPLFVMGAYSPPFLDFIETASVTTFPTTPFDALRGTSAWVPYIDPTWQGGLETLRTGYLALNSGVLLMLGLVGMSLRGNPHRLFLVLSLVLGLLLVTMGHQGSTEGWFAGALNAQLDQALAPLRNVHKFDPVVRLPMVLGLAWLLEQAVRALAESPPRTWWSAPPAPVVGLAVLALLGVSLPAVTGQLTTTRPVLETPGYWREAAAWLEDNGGNGVALLAPGSSFGSYAWGEPRDEPLQYLARSPWAVRNAIPLAPPGNIRMLDAVEERLDRGVPSPGLAPYLRRAGVRYVVVRNDLRTTGDVPEAALVHEALAGSPGLRLATTFGPVVGGRPFLRKDGARLVVNGGWQTYRRAIEVYEVEGAARAVAGERLPVVVGGPEDLLDLADQGVLRDEPTQLAVDVPAGSVPEGPVVLTDGMLDRERFFGRVHDGYSAVRTPGDRRRSGNPTADYLLAEGNRWSTTARLDGLRAIAASSSASDSNARRGSRPGELPFAAVDGDPGTSWVAGPGREAWWRAELDAPLPLGEVDVTVGRGPAQIVRVVTAAGSSEPVPVEPGTTTGVAVPPGETGWVRVEDARGGAAAFTLAEVDWAGRGEVTRPLVLPVLPEDWGAPDQVLLRALRDPRTGCATVEGSPRCLEDRARPSEETDRWSRVVTMPEAADYPVVVRAVPRPGRALTTMLQEGQAVTVAGSSTGPPDSRVSPLAAVDGSLRTTWTAAVGDGRAQLDLEWLGERRITGIRVRRNLGVPVRRPSVVRLRWPGGSQTVSLGRDGRTTFPPIRTERISVRVVESENAVSVNADGSRSLLPVGIGELRLRGLGLLPAPPSRQIRSWPCGTGPTVTVAGARVRTALQASAADLFAMETVPALPCRPSAVDVGAGENVVEVEASDVAVADSVRLGSVPGTASVTPVGLDVVGPVERRFVPPAGSAVVAVRENANPGWEATRAGEPVQPVVVDGWQQGWRTDGGTGPVIATFAPDGAYRTGLAVGAGLFLLLALLPLVPSRRWPGATLPALAPARAPLPVLLGAGVVATGLLAGWVGVASFAVTAAVARLLRNRVPGDTATWFAGSLLLAAAVAYFLRPWGSQQGWAGELAWPHYLVVTAVSWALVACVEPRPSPRRRMAGSSTTR